MIINRSAIKQNAKNIISSAKPSPVLVGLVYLGIVAVLQLLSSTVSGEFHMYMEYLEQTMAGNAAYLPVLPQINTVSYILIVAITLMNIMMSAGYTIYCMHICQFKEAGFANLFDGFAIFLKVILLEIIMGIFVWLWSLLLIVPGIIAAYRYRMALYILIDNPNMSPIECIRASKQMMNGRKGELFVLDLSFLGWFILTLVPFVTVWVTPYTSVTYTNYYLALRDMPSSSFEKMV